MRVRPGLNFSGADLTRGGGPGQAGARLVGSLLESGHELAVLDLQPLAAEPRGENQSGIAPT